MRQGPGSLLVRRPRPEEFADGLGGVAPSAGAPAGSAPPREHPLRALLSGYRHIVRDRVVFGVMAAGGRAGPDRMLPPGGHL